MHRIQSKQQGRGLPEYLVIVGLIVVASIAAVGFLGGTVRSEVAAVTSQFADSKIMWEDCEKRSVNCNF